MLTTAGNSVYTQVMGLTPKQAAKLRKDADFIQGYMTGHYKNIADAVNTYGASTRTVAELVGLSHTRVAQIAKKYADD